MSDQEYPPIDQYAFLSDCHTSALIGPDGAVEWLCVPRFDGASIFGRVLDRLRGGFWKVDVVGARVSRREYCPESLVLRTYWDSDDGSVTIHEFLATATRSGSDEMNAVGRLVREVTCTRGRVRLRSQLRARPDYGRREATWAVAGECFVERSGVSVSADPASALAASGARSEEAALRGTESVLSEGESAAFALDYLGAGTEPITLDEAERLRRNSVRAWGTWSDHSDYEGARAAQVRHSAVVLRGLLFDENDALLAAPTTSLPEWPGGPRNWDYRYVWHRDASLVVLELLRLGHEEDAERYLRSLLGQCTGAADWLRPMFAIDGGGVPAESTLDHLDGYAGSRPVRIGNRAEAQHQLDVYGHILDAAYTYHQVTGKLTESDTEILWRVVSAARRHWREPDAGIWEVQGSERHWTHSKVYTWACFDRAIRLAELTDDPAAPVDEWRRERDLVRADVLANGFDRRAGSFVQSYGSTNVDASLLRIPILGFVDGDDPRVLRTLERIDAELGDGTGLIRRYDPEATEDGMDSPEGAFLLSSFEMVTALVLAGRTIEAEQRFSALLERAEPLGLFSEQMRADGTMLGNFPQAFTHLGIIQAAVNIDEAGRRDALHDWAERRHVGREEPRLSTALEDNAQTPE
jgi:alpha,alpha-trehalase